MGWLSRVSTVDDVARALRGSGRPRFVWFGLGVLAFLLAVGGRWDLPLLAWVFPVLLLRFARLSPSGSGLALVAGANILAAGFWAYALAVPQQPSTVLLCTLFGLIYSVPYVVDRLLSPRLGVAGRLFLFPVAFVACELLMGAYSPLGTAYGLLAVTQRTNLDLLQVTSLIGPYAIGFLIAWFATVINWWLETPGPASSLGLKIGSGYLLVLVVVLLGGQARLSFFPPAASYVRIAGIAPGNAAVAEQVRRLTQPGMDSPDAKRAAYAVVHDDLFASTRKAARAGAKIVVWSENAAVLLPADRDAFLARAAVVAREENIYLNVADNIPNVDDETHLIGPAGQLLWSYRKAHPIPGMEAYVPGGKAPPVFQTPYGRLANIICYDADFPLTARIRTDLLVVPGADWPEMGRTHTQMASLRAIENGYSLFRADSNGHSAAFDHQGRVVGQQDTTTRDEHILIADVPNKGVVTLYSLIGDLFGWVCVGVMALFGFLAIRRGRAKSSPG